ncbi:hypothetical protein, partial [Serratia fonticola]|uniref:hypothetical protein n=1 Tax=Serratia fonticola TaxID=47917 RepID=UPI003AAAEC01
MPETTDSNIMVCISIYGKEGDRNFVTLGIICGNLIFLVKHNFIFYKMASAILTTYLDASWRYF